MRPLMHSAANGRKEPILHDASLSMAVYFTRRYSSNLVCFQHRLRTKIHGGQALVVIDVAVAYGGSYNPIGYCARLNGQSVT